MNNNLMLAGVVLDVVLPVVTLGVGFITGILVGRKNKNTVNKVVGDVKSAAATVDATAKKL